MNLQEITTALVELDDVKVKALVKTAIDQGMDPEVILKNGLIPGIEEVGRLFSRKEYFVPEVLVAAEAFYAGFDLLKAVLKKKPFSRPAKILVAVVEGDIHDIGKNIMKILIETAGFEVVDLGRDVRTSTLLDAVRRERPAVICLSALMTTTMTVMPQIINQIKKMAIDWPLKIIVGGAPVTADYAAQINAEGYAPDAGAAVDLIIKLTNEV